MAKVVLVRFPYSHSIYKVYKKIPKDREVRPPLGLMYIAAALERGGHTVVIIDGEPDCMSFEDMADAILVEHPDFVGMTATTPEFHVLCEMCDWLKRRNSSIVTVAGGAHVSALPQHSLDACSDLDYVVVNEGEVGMLAIVNGGIESKIVRPPLLSNLDILLPARHLIDYSKYQYPIPGKGMVRMDAIESSRGCPFSCTFCYKRRTKHRLRNPVLVVDEIEDSHNRYGTEFFMFFDDTLTVNKPFVMEICNGIIRRGLNKKICFYANTRANTTDKEMLIRMKMANITEMSTGVESGNERILKNIKKGTRKERYKKVYKDMYDIGLQTRGSFIVGFPYDTHETVMETIDFARELNLMRASCNILTPYPGTEVYDDALNNRGLHFVDTDLDWEKFKRWGNSTVRTDELSKDDLEYYQKLFLTLFYSQRKVVWYHIKQLFKGNLSYYFYRPIIFAFKNRLKMVFQGNFNGRRKRV
jgi:radical SAM superfamily enzyme YgiQ (UPF0313 family)